MKGPYDDIIHLPHPVSKTHSRMSMIERAAQFSPFAALTGYGAAIKETARLTDRKLELDEETQALLDLRQHFLLEHLAQRPEVTITYFEPDAHKEGGSYQTITARVKKLDEYQRLLILEGGRSIPLDDIAALSGALFERMGLGE